MATMNISLPDELNAFALDQAGKKGFATAGEYIMSLILEAHEREEDSERLDDLLLEGLDSGVVEPLGKKDWEDIQREGERLFEEQRKSR